MRRGAQLQGRAQGERGGCQLGAQVRSWTRGGQWRGSGRGYGLQPPSQVRAAGSALAPTPTRDTAGRRGARGEEMEEKER